MTSVKNVAPYSKSVFASFKVLSYLLYLPSLKSIKGSSLFKECMMDVMSIPTPVSDDKDKERRWE